MTYEFIKEMLEKGFEIYVELSKGINIDTIERWEIIRDFDVTISNNLFIVSYIDEGIDIIFTFNEQSEFDTFILEKCNYIKFIRKSQS